MVFGTLGSSANQILIKIKGDDKDFQGALKSSESGMSGFTSKMKAAGPMIGAAFAAVAVGFVAMSVKMAAAEEVVNRQTESMLKSKGIMWSKVSNEVVDYINKLEEMTAYGDTDLQMAFNRMISSGMSYTDTLESMKMVTDIAYTRNMDLVTSADLVTKAYNGQASSLKRYGIVVADGVTGAEALDAVQETVSKNFADASDRTETLEGKMALLTTQTDDFAEALGDELLPMLIELTGQLTEAGDSSDSLATKLGKGIIAPYESGKAMKDIHIAAKEHGDLRRKGIDTEKELVNWYSLESDKLTGMSDEYFQHTMLVMKLYGYDKKRNDLIQARAYALEMQNRALNEQKQIEGDLLRIEEDITKEGEKQLSLEEKKAAYLSKYGQSEGMRAASAGISIGQVSGTSEAFAAGEAYTRQSGAHTITYIGRKSGAP